VIVTTTGERHETIFRRAPDAFGSILASEKQWSQSGLAGHTTMFTASVPVSARHLPSLLQMRSPVKPSRNAKLDGESSLMPVACTSLTRLFELN
jgi:hypothetical protein